MQETRRPDETFAGSAPDYRVRGPWALAHALGFTPDDLDANRQGRMSERQAARIRRQVAAQVARAIVIWLPLFIILTLLFDRATIDGVLWALVITGAPFLVGVVPLWKLVADANALRVEKLSGPATAERWQPAFWARGGRLFRLRPGYYFRVDGERLRVSREVYLTLSKGWHTFYVTPAARRIVSAEPA